MGAQDLRNRTACCRAHEPCQARARVVGVGSIEGVAMAISDTSFERQIDRRTFLLAGIAVVAGGAVERPRRLETFTQWLKASRKARELALPPCVERIRSMDPSILAWVQVSPQRPTGNGALSEIPFGAKDVIETKGLATEYGSPKIGRAS